MDVLRNQIIERKVIGRILAEAEFKEVPYDREEVVAEAIDRAAGGGDSDIPEAKPEHEEKVEGGEKRKPESGQLSAGQLFADPVGCNRRA